MSGTKVICYVIIMIIIKVIIIMLNNKQYTMEIKAHIDIFTVWLPGTKQWNY